MRAIVYQILLREVDALKAADEPAKKAFREVIRRIAKDQGVGSLERGERVEYAGEMLGRLVQRVFIRDRLKARFHISKTQAYRDIEEALQLSHKPPLNGTRQASNRNA